MVMVLKMGVRSSALDGRDLSIDVWVLLCAYTGVAHMQYVAAVGVM